jgi:hypothetical protein
VVQDRGNWQVVVNTVIDLWVPSDVVSFLTELLGSHKGQYFVKFIYLFIYLFIYSFIPFSQLVSLAVGK